MNPVSPATARFSKPPLWLLPLEGRALWERAALPLVQPLLGRAPRGDGHAVMVLPGFLAGDGSTAALRRFLSRLGYQVSPWGLGRNLGPSDALVGQLRERLTLLRQQSGRRVSLIGWSLGGIYARELARAMPNAVRGVVTLGSPLYGHPAHATRTWSIYRAVSGQTEVRRSDRGDGPPSVRVRARKARRDAGASWPAPARLRTEEEAKAPLRDSVPRED